MSLIRNHHFVAVFALLVLLEVLTFGPIVPKVGFYLDDWNMVRQLHFGPQGFWQMLQHYFLNDPKIIPRPVEALHFILMFKMFGLKPLGYHVFNGAMEVFTAWLGYVCARRISGSKLLALIASILFLLYPIHDSTHYWIVSSSATLSLLCYMAGLWCHMEANARQQKSLFVAAYSLFLVSIFNYECYLPLFPLTVAAALYISPRDHKLRDFCVQSIPYVLSILAVIGYGRFIVPMLGTAWMHSVHIDPVAIASTVARGVQVSMGADTLSFLWSRIALDSSVKAAVNWLFAGIAVAAGAVLVKAFSTETIDTRRVLHIGLFGVSTVLLSYTIFGLNNEYWPTLMTFVNRVNYAAAFGVGLLFAALICAMSPRFRTPVLATSCTAMLVFCMFANWTLARPWKLSWMMQRHVQSVLVAHRAEIRPGDSIMLLNSPRYVMWAPVFDGTWDFQNVVQLSLNDDTIHGGVVSERLEVQPNAAKDISHGFVCGTYPYSGMHALVATKSLLLPVHSADDFIGIVSTHGMAFDLDKNLPATWRTQITSRVEATQ